MDREFTIDIHTHIIPEDLPDFGKKFGTSGYIHLDHHKPGCARMMKGDQFFREIKDNCWDAGRRIHECNAAGVDVQVLSTIPVLFNYWAKPEHCLEVSKYLNDHIANLVDRNPKRFAGLGTLPMQAPELAIRELERCSEIGLKGIQIGTHIENWNLDQAELFPVFEACQELGMAVFVHPWDMMGKDSMQKYWLPWLVGMPAESSRAICSMIFGGVFERLPRLRVAFAHGGGSFPATIGRIEHGFNVRPDLVATDNKVNPRHYLGRFFVDTLVHDPVMLQYLIDLIGAGSLALGSDYPFPLGEEEPGKLIRPMGIDNNLREQLLHRSALEWLNLQISDFG